ncbi:mucin-binding protein [Lactobacillus johnsonii]
MFSKEQLQRFSIRKLTVGTASVLIGVLFLTSWNTNNVYADSRNVTSGESIAKNNNPQEGNPAVNKDNVQIVDNDSTEVSNISDSKSSKVIKSDATKSDIVRDKTTIDDNSGTKVPELTVQANNKQALTTVTEDNGAKVSKTEKYSNSDIKNQSRNSEKAQETTLVKKVLEKKVLDKEKLSSESLIDQKKLDGKVEIPATDPSNTITATDPSNYPKLNGLIGEDKYIYQVLSLEPEYWYSRSKLILSVNRNDPNDKNIYAYVIDGNYNYNNVEKSITIGMDKSSIITIDGREYRLNNNGSSEVSINGKTVSTQNSSTVTSKPGYLDNLPISQDYGLGNTSNGNCSAIGEIVPVFTKNSVIKYYYRDNEGHLQEFKNSELPNVSVEGFTGQEFEIDDVGQYKKVIQGYHLTSAPTGNFKGTLSQFSDDKYYKKVYYDFGTNKVKYSVLYHQIYPDGTMEVWLVDGKGDALTETRKIAPNTSIEFSNYDHTLTIGVRNPYVTAAQHEVQFIYSPDAQHMTITYVDDTTGKTLLTVTKDGVSDGSTNYNTKNDIDGYKAQHYNIVSDSTNGHDLVFDHNDNVDQHYEVHLSHATHPVDEAHDVSQVVHYIYTDGSKAANDYTNQVHFTRDGYHDEVTNEDHWNAWKPAQQEFASVKSPEIQGYTADQVEIPVIKVNSASDNIERTVTYKANKQKLDVIFIDDTTGKTLVTVTKDGVSDDSANYNTKNDIDGYKAQHYNIVSDSTNGHDLVFDHNDNVDQHYEVHLSHATHPVDEAHDVSQVVHYIYADGSKAANDYTNHVHFARDGYRDEVTNEDHWNAWTPSATYDFVAVQSPKIQGFTPDIQTIDQTTVTPSSQNIEQTVTYYGDVQLGHVKYIDDSDNGRVMSSDNLSGHTGETDSYTTAKNIKTYIAQGYVFVSDNYPATGVVFDNNDLVDQDFEVHFKHGTHSISEDHDISQIIHYVYQNGSKAANDHTNQVHFTRDGDHDEVTNEDHWNAWKPAQQEFVSVKSPDIQGYTADQVEIPTIKVNADSDNIEHTVTYKANKQKLDVAFIDDTTGETLLTVTKDGVSDGSTNYNTANDLDHYKSLHFNVVSDSTNGHDLVFDHNDNVDQHYEVHLSHATHPVDEAHDVSQVVHYIYTDGSKAANDYTNQVHFTRDGYHDEVTNEDHWNAWKPAQQEFASVKSPEIQGYTADQVEIPVIKVNSASDNIERTVTYKANKQKLDVIFIDDTAGKTLLTVTKDGVSDGSTNYNTANDLDHYKSLHFNVVSDGTQGQNLVFDHDDSKDQHYEVHLVHATHSIDDQTTKSEAIHYVYADGLARQGKVTDDNVQQLSFKRDGYNDEVTGTDHWNAWTPANSQYEAVDSPVIQGYTPDKSVIEKSTVNPTDKDIEITVTYNADKQTAHVIYVDKTTNTTLISDDLSGKSDKDSEYNTEDKIGKYKSQHYVLVEDETNGKNVIFDHNDKQDQTYYVYFVHGEQKVNRQNTVTATIDYKFEDGKTAQPTVTQTKHFSEGGVKDLVTGKIAWDEAKPQKFDDVTTPAISGYTPDKDKVAGSTVKFGDKDIEVTVTYHNNAQKASVTYIDDKTGKTLKVDNLNGVTNAKSGYTTKAAIDTYTGLGYTLVSDDTNGNEVVFDNDDANDQAFTVHLSHGTITVTPENPGKRGEPVDPDNPDGPKYRAGTDKTGLTDTVNRTITYVMSDGSKAPEAVHDSLSYTASKVIDKVTLEVLETKWSANQDFKDVDSPSVKGYTPDKKTVSNKNVAHDAADITETVKYSADAQKASVTYIDDKTGKTLKVDNLNGVTNAKSGYTTKAAIDTYTGLGYTLVSDDTNGNEVVFDNDDANDQAFTVHLSHGTITVTPENPGKPGEPVDPDNPDGPKYPDGTDEYQVKRTGTQTIHYVGANDKTPADNNQTFIFTREITFDNVTGNIISVTPWNVQSHTFGNVDTPVIPGYHADKAVAGGATVTPDDLNRVITVTYAPDGNPGNPGDQGDTPTPEPTPEPDPTPNPTPDDQPDSEISSDEHFENVKAKDKLDKTNPKKMDAYKKERKIIKTKIAKQDHTEIAEPKLPQTGEADNSIIGLLGMLLASFAAMFGFDSLHSHDKKHKN